VRIVLACATHRGLRVLERLLELAPDAELLVFSFPEEPYEPPFLDAIRARCRQAGASFHEARHLGAGAWDTLWETTPFDLLLAVSWRYLIPRRVYSQARIGAFVFHDSLLPAYRGFSPTVWAMIHGEDHTGVTLFEMAEEVDAGDVLDQERVPIGPEETIREVLERVTATYLDVLARNLDDLLAGDFRLRPQDPDRATYCCKRLLQDNEIDWGEGTERIHDLIRAVTHPYPGAFTQLNGRRLTVWEARRPDDPPVYRGRIPGRVVEVRPGEGSLVLTGDGVLLLTRVQLEGEEEAAADRVLRRISQTLGPLRAPARDRPREGRP
jgi:methionyl-tRNA formyltransferase